MKILRVIALLALPIFAFGQYEFQGETRIDCSSIKSQQRTGTCWSFSTTSFLESELLRTGKGSIDLSEMYSVRKIYEDKAINYVLRQGKANFSQGSLAHDVLNTVKSHGMMTDEAYPGKLPIDEILNHGEMVSTLKAYLDAVIDTGKPGPHWKNAVKGILDAYMGPVPETFTHDGKEYDAKSFASAMDINPASYVHLTSFTHRPFNDYFILEIPDNYSNGSFYNIPLDQMMETVDNALANGYSVEWDGDVSEKGFSQREGIAVLPENDRDEELFKSVVKEVDATQELRQTLFENYKTTDDHLMHVVGKAKDQNGTNYYIIKNSWGEMGPYSGYLYMSESFFRMKTVSVTIHEDALPKALSKALNN